LADIFCRYLRSLGVIRGSVGLAFILVLLGSVGCLPDVETRQRELWRLPQSYQGWIYTRWNAPNCPPLEVRDGYLVIEVPPTGVVCTSSGLQEGTAIDRFVYVVGDDGDLDIDPSLAHERVFGNGTDLYVFIGSTQDFGFVPARPPSRYGP
jgi:hypothetical protein